MDKYLAKDIALMVVSLIVGFVVGLIFYFINPYLPTFIYIGIGGVMAIVVYVMYLILRKPDLQIALERKLLKTAKNAESIGVFANNLRGYPAEAAKIGKISQKIAKLGYKCIRRELIPLEVEIGHLLRLSETFLRTLSVLSGDVRLAAGKMERELSQIVEEHIPSTLNAVEQLEVAIDASVAKRYARAEADLAVITALYENHRTGQEAAEMLRDLMEKEY